MDKLQKGMLKCNFFKFPIIFLVVINLTQCNGKTLKLTEGDTTDLDFSYPCESSDITLRISNSKPFYSLQHQALYSMPHRYKVNVQNESGECTIHLRIDPVTREDGGTCILTVYINGDPVDEYTQGIGLNIAYPPGPASCELREGIEIGNWVALQCTSSAGNLPGQIECYQGGEKLPPQSSLTKIYEILQQTFWVMNQSYPTFCCTSALEQPKDKCECKDFVWDLSNKTQSNITDQTTENRIQIISTVDPAQNATNEITQTSQCNTTSISKSLLLILCIVIAVTVLSVIINIVTVRKLNSHKNDKHVKNEHQSKGKQVHSKADYKKVDIIEGEV